MMEIGMKRLVKPLAGRSAREWVPLSSADFVAPDVHVELLLAYEAAPPTSALEAGLQKVLCDYREWAGRIEPAHPEAGRPAILLNDAGIAFFEAQAQDPLHELLPFNPSLLLHSLIPPTVGAPELLLVQVTRFPCGGITVGVAWHHRVADAEAALDFLLAWTLAVQGLPSPFSSSQDRSVLMGKDLRRPMHDHMDSEEPAAPSETDVKSSTPRKEEIVVRKLNFSAELLKEIKDAATREGEEFTRFESLMGHLWRCITSARGLDKEDGGEAAKEATETMLAMAVNARTRMDPKIGKGYFGNVVCVTCAGSKANILTKEPLKYGARLVKDAIRMVDENFVRSLLDSVETRGRCLGGGIEGCTLSPNLTVSSWANYPLYNLNFGFGFPIFAGFAYMPYEGLLIIFPPPQPDGSLDVVLGLFAPAMETFLSTYHLIL